MKNWSEAPVRSNVRAILEGAFMSAIFLVLFFVAFYTPLSVVAAFALPVPFSIYGYRHDTRMGVLTVLVAAILSFIFTSFPGLLISLPAAVMGLVMGIAYRKQKSARYVLVLGMVTQLAFIFVSIGIVLAITQTNPVNDMIEGMGKLSNQMLTEMQGQVDHSIKQLPPEQQNGIQGKQLARVKESLESMKVQLPVLISAILPGLLISSSLLAALINHGLFRKVLQRMGTQIQALPALHNLRFPRSILYYYLIVLFLFMIPELHTYRFLYTVVLNVMIVLQLLFAVQALGFVAYWIHKRNVSKGLLILAVILFLIPPFTYILLLIGVLDVGFNLRNRFFNNRS
ncbi:hypothetical protein HMPREF0083_05927 [Aneurinibacillus aneurinilyticus ATCC 12856]|uniref:DUF2232 domain-containing protein n=2 Tax=Aneurinibacillus aneurinilyticus TaxID=1391 RepID=U1W8N5_ANEAE|nr:hypothetical protein HMPREF0083_05927 [Aneurinibacillus aneurinilyticus ATCC 12856]